MIVAQHAGQQAWPIYISQDDICTHVSSIELVSRHDYYFKAVGVYTVFRCYFLCPLAVSFVVVLQSLCDGVFEFELPAPVYKHIPV